jgi:hypothetical protein
LIDNINVKSILGRAANDGMMEIDINICGQTHLVGGSEDCIKISWVNERIRVNIHLLQIEKKVHCQKTQMCSNSKHCIDHTHPTIIPNDEKPR